MEVASELFYFSMSFSCNKELFLFQKEIYTYISFQTAPKARHNNDLPAEIVASDAQWCSKQYVSNPWGQRSYRFPLVLQRHLNKFPIIGVTRRSNAATIASFCFTILLFHLVYWTIVMSQDPEYLPTCKGPLFRIMVLMG